MLPVRQALLVVTVFIASAAGLFLGGCSSLPPETGPTVGVRNDSDAPLRATFWIGDRNDQMPGAHAEMKSQETMEIPPFGTKQFKLGAFSGFDSATESFVRLQIEEVGPSFQVQGQHWFELNPPAPYTIRVSGNKAKLAFDRVGGGSIVAVPQSLWFRNASVMASTNSAVTSNTTTKSPSSAPASATVSGKSRTKQPIAANTLAKPGKTPATTTTNVTGVPDNQQSFGQD